MVRYLSIIASALVASTACNATEAPERSLPVSPSGVMKVAFVVAKSTTLIDIAGPLQVFNDAKSPGTTGFKSFTVSDSRTPIESGGLSITPDYTFDNVPDADIIVVPASTGTSQPYMDFLRKAAAQGKIIMSVCTGASKLAQAGLLDGRDATSHHDFIDGFIKKYPKVHFIRDRAWVHSAPNIYTAGGETSGIELALHLTELYFGRDVAIKTARYMEYRGPDWQPRT